MHATKSSRAYMHESAAAEEDVRRISLSSTADLPSALRNCSNQLTPDCIRALYSIPARSRAVPGNSLGLYQQGGKSVPLVNRFEWFVSKDSKFISPDRL